MKVILNQDVKHLGEEGDVKDVAMGYARNYLFPRNLAVPHNDVTVAHFAGRKAEIEAKKQVKRADAASLKEKLESAKIALVMPAGANGKLYGAVTNQTIADELAKLGYEIERKRIELPGLTFKSVGKYRATIRLYEGALAEIEVIVEAQPENKTESHPPRHERRERRDRDYERNEAPVETEEAADEAVAEE